MKKTNVVKRELIVKLVAIVKKKKPTIVVEGDVVVINFCTLAENK